MMADSYQFTLDWDLPAAASIASARGAAPIGGVCSHAHRAVPRAAKWFWMLVGAGGMYWFLSRRAQRQALLARAQAKRKIAGAGSKGKTAKVQKEEWVIRLSKEVVGAEEEVGDELDADTDEDDRDGVQVRRKNVCLNRAEATETAIDMLESTLNSISLAVDSMKTKLAERRTTASPADSSFTPITAQEAAL